MSKVSIILPVFNCERYIATSIESVLAQTHQNWELLISDNCSEDSSYEIARSYADQDPRISCWRNEKNIDVVANYNNCLAKCTGNYIELFGSDDLFEPTCIEKLARVLDEHQDVAIVTSGRRFIDSEGNCTKTERAFDSSRLIPADEAIRSTLGAFNNWIVSPVMFRSALKGSGFDPSLRLWSDIDYWTKILQGGNLFYLDELLFNYRVHDASETSRAFKDFEFVLDVMRMADKHPRYFNNSDQTDEASRRALMDKLVELVKHALSHRGANFSSFISPRQNHSSQEANMLSSEPARLALLIQEHHDYRRVACLALLHTIELISEQNDERSIFLQKQLDCDLLIKELRAEIERLTQNRDKVLQKREVVERERDLLNERVLVLDSNLRSLKNEHTVPEEQYEAVLREQERLAKSVEMLRQEINQSQIDLTALLNSSSWKITAPIRQFKKLLGN